MKGLILKDWYLMIKYCKSFLLLIIVFTAVSFSGEENAFFLMYPCVMASMLPMTLCSYDEREKWCTYSLTLPVSKTQYVSAKYILGLIINIAVVIAIGAALACRMLSFGSFDMVSYMSTLGVIAASTILLPSILMPFVYKFGTEKARIAYMGAIVVAFTLSAIFSTIAPEAGFSLGSGVGIALMVVVLVVAYAVSWFISVKLYNKREI